MELARADGEQCVANAKLAKSDGGGKAPAKKQSAKA